jgi:exonuclease III
VLTEFRASGASQRLLSELADEFPFFHSTPSPGLSRNGVAVISRHELRAEPVTGVIAGEEHRWAEVLLHATGLRIVGLYVPGAGGTAESRAFKAQFWAAMLAAAPALAEGKTVVIGDLNTGLHRIDETQASFRCADQFEAFGTILVDAWREAHGVEAREFSWHSHVGNGFRIDHAFVSPCLAPLVEECRYDHAPRLASSTDHAMLLLSIAMPDLTPGA